MRLSKQRIVASLKQKRLLMTKAEQMCRCTGLAPDECLESLDAIRQNIGEACFQGVNWHTYRLILTHRKAGHTPRRAAFRAVQDFYC
jgi:hypothetical protein